LANFILKFCNCLTRNATRPTNFRQSVRLLTNVKCSVVESRISLNLTHMEFVLYIV